MWRRPRDIACLVWCSSNIAARHNTRDSKSASFLQRSRWQSAQQSPTVVVIGDSAKDALQPVCCTYPASHVSSASSADKNPSALRAMPPAARHRPCAERVRGWDRTLRPAFLSRTSHAPHISPRRRPQQHSANRWRICNQITLSSRFPKNVGEFTHAQLCFAAAKATALTRGGPRSSSGAHNIANVNAAKDVSPTLLQCRNAASPALPSHPRHEKFFGALLRKARIKAQRGSIHQRPADRRTTPNTLLCRPTRLAKPQKLARDPRTTGPSHNARDTYRSCHASCAWSRSTHNGPADFLRFSAAIERCRAHGEAAKRAEAADQ
jgi:hypothetical protein